MARWVAVRRITVDAIDGNTGETIQKVKLQRLGPEFEAPDRREAERIGKARWPNAAKIESVASLEARSGLDPEDA
jgi:hypothetical protein